jgi:polyhydroxyalkanoate synthesis regulator phasin
MSDNTHNLTLDVLKQIQSGFAEMRDRLDRIEEINRKQRRDSAGMLVMMRATAGDFDERVSEVEERVAALEAAERRI